MVSLVEYIDEFVPVNLLQLVFVAHGGTLPYNLYRYVPATVKGMVFKQFGLA